jgi:hypothetical protein
MYPSTISVSKYLNSPILRTYFQLLKNPNKHLYLVHQTDCSINKLFLQPKIKNIAFDWD